MATLTPAYGRDYKSKKEVLKDFLDGKDFIYNDPFRQCYCSIRDFKPGDVVNLRYHKLTRVTSHRIK